MRSVTQNWRRPAHYLKMDLANFRRHRQACSDQPAGAPGSTSLWWCRLALQVLWHDPRVDYEVQP